MYNYLKDKHLNTIYQYLKDNNIYDDFIKSIILEDKNYKEIVKKYKDIVKKSKKQENKEP